MKKSCGQRRGEHRRGVFAVGTGRYARLAIADEVTPGDELARIVHDFKNPLASIALETELLDARIACCDGVDVSQAIARIRRNVRFLDRLVNDLLDGCTLSNGKLALRRAPCELRGLLAGAIDRVVPCSDRHRVFLDAPEAAEVMVDELRIERVIATLLDNALKYTPVSGGIIVRLNREQHSAQISICDAGPGLSAAEIEAVFEPYRRTAAGTARPGSGLGLYVSKQIVEAHGGKIGVESVRGLGARFFIALPVT